MVNAIGDTPGLDVETSALEPKSSFTILDQVRSDLDKVYSKVKRSITTKDSSLLITALVVLVLGFGAIASSRYFSFTTENRAGASIRPVTFNPVASKTSVGIGEMFEVKLFIDPQQQELTGFESYLKYDPQFLEIVSSESNEFLGKTITNTFNNSTGIASFVAIASCENNVCSTPTESGFITNYTFKAIGNTEGTSLTFSTTTPQTLAALTKEIAYADLDLVSTQISIINPDPEPVPPPSENPAPEPTPSSQPTPVSENLSANAELRPANGPNNDLIVSASSSLGPDAVITVEGYGELRYDKRLEQHTRTFKTKDTPAQLTISSSGGGSLTIEVK